jgi:hypothetical protein
MFVLDQVEGARWCNAGALATEDADSLGVAVFGGLKCVGFITDIFRFQLESKNAHKHF